MDKEEVNILTLFVKFIYTPTWINYLNHIHTLQIVFEHFDNDCIDSLPFVSIYFFPWHPGLRVLNKALNILYLCMSFLSNSSYPFVVLFKILFQLCMW